MEITPHVCVFYDVTDLSSYICCYVFAYAQYPLRLNPTNVEKCRKIVEEPKIHFTIID